MAQVVPGFQAYSGANYDRWCGIKAKYDQTGATAAGTAGVYTAGILLPPYCYLLNVMLVGVTLWNNGTSAGAIVGDDDDDNGFFTTTNLKATDLLAGEAIQIAAGTAMAGGLIGAYVANSAWAVGGGSTSGIYRTVARTVTCTITTVGTVATAGETHLLVNFLSFSGVEPMGISGYVAT